MKLNPRITAIVLIIIYLILVFFCCLYRFSGSESLNLHQYFLGIRLDRYVHFTMFFPYPFVAWFYLSYSKKLAFLQKYIYPATLVSGIMLAIIAEASQEFLTQYRDADTYDLIANFTGVFTATLIVYLSRKSLKKICNCIFEL